MTATTKAAKITCEVYRSLAAPALAALGALRVDHVQVHSRRAVVLRERALLPFLPPTTRLEEDPAEVLEIYVAREQASSALLAWARELRLFTPGRGAIYAEAVELVAPPGLAVCSLGLALPGDDAHAGERLSPLALVNCVVQRGHGNEVARCALDRGSNVPTVNFGVGTGLRDRLGLLRIAIPADKEIVSLLVDADDLQATFDALIDAGRLDQPGRGFIGAYPVMFGVANPKSLRGQQRHHATMDQVIAALDDLKAGTEWRRRAAAGDGGARPPRHCLTDQANVTLTGNEGSADALVAAAMRAGAKGATTSKARRFSPGGKDLGAFAGREVVDFGIDPGRVDALVGLLNADGAFGAEVACVVETRPLPRAFTYLGG